MLVAMTRERLIHNLKVIFFCAAVFYLLGEPARQFLRISETTEVRFTAFLPFLFATIWGARGAFACALANMFGDISNELPASIYIPGFFLQFSYGYFPAFVWRKLRRKDKNIFQLNRVYKVVQFMLISTVTSCYIGAMVCMIIKVNNFPVSLDLFWNVMFNQLVAIPVANLPMFTVCSLGYQNYMRKHTKSNTAFVFSLTLNEKFLLFFLLASILLAIGFGLSVHKIYSFDTSLDALHLWNNTYYASVFALNLSIWFSLLFLHFVERTVTKPVEKMSEITKIFAEESDIDAKIHAIKNKSERYLGYSSEVGSLARSFHEMSKELKIYVSDLTTATEERQKEHTALAIATAIQNASMPKPVVFKRIDLFASMDPALEVGGDFYDFFKIDEDHIAMCIADVSGKGVPAALFMMCSKIILQHNLKNGYSPAESLMRTNEELCENNVVDMFVSCLCGVLDLKTNILTFANAGHERPAFKKKGCEFYIAKIKSGFVLGGMPGMKYQNFELQMEPGDVMFTYTDGIPEAMNSDNEEFGNERMLAALNASKDENVENICKNVREAVRKHAGDAPQFDDVTMLAFGLREAKNA